MGNSCHSRPQSDPSAVWQKKYYNMVGEKAPRYDGPYVGTYYHCPYEFTYRADLTMHAYRNHCALLIRLNYDMLQFIANWEIAEQWGNGSASKTFTFDNRIINVTLEKNKFSIFTVIKRNSIPIIRLPLSDNERKEMRHLAYLSARVIANYLVRNKLTSVPNIVLTPDTVDYNRL